MSRSAEQLLKEFEQSHIVPELSGSRRDQFIALVQEWEAEIRADAVAPKGDNDAA